MPTRGVNLLGVDVSSWVLTYGTLEEIQSALFSTSQIFMPELSLTLDNTKKIYSPNRPGSLFGQAWYNRTGVVYRDGEVAFSGLIRGVSPNHSEKTCNITLTNFLVRAADTRITLVATNQNPAAVIQALLITAGLESYLDQASFVASVRTLQDEQATIDVNFTDSDGITALDAINQVADTCSLVITSSSNGTIRLHSFRSYPGNESALRQLINPAVSRGMTNMPFDEKAFSTRVTVNYGVNSSIVLTAPTVAAKQLTTKESSDRDQGIDARTGTKVVITTQASAAFFGQLLLNRSSYIRRIFGVALGREFAKLRVGDRHPITSDYYGLTREPFEAIEVRKSFTSEDVEAVFASLS